MAGKAANENGNLLARMVQVNKVVTVPAGSYTLLPKAYIAKSAVYKSSRGVSVKDSKGAVKSYEGGLLAYPGEDAPHAVYYRKYASAASSIANVLLIGNTGISKNNLVVSDTSGVLAEITTNE